MSMAGVFMAELYAKRKAAAAQCLRSKRNCSAASQPRLREAALDLYRALVSEHGHDETAPAPWPQCLPVHIAMRRYREAADAALSAELGDK